MREPTNPGLSHGVWDDSKVMHMTGFLKYTIVFTSLGIIYLPIIKNDRKTLLGFKDLVVSASVN